MTTSKFHFKLPFKNFRATIFSLLSSKTELPRRVVHFAESFKKSELPISSSGARNLYGRIDLEVMEPPQPPSESDCCNSGCNPCILDAYEAHLKKYEKLQAKHLVNAINGTTYTVFTLIDREQVAQNVYLFTFQYCDERSDVNCFDCEPGRYLLLNGGDFTRAYTPIPLKKPPLGFTVLVRVYENGRMSRLLRRMQIGCKTSWRGPYGDFEISYKHKYLLFVAQGTGIAPLYALIHEIVHDEDCESFVMLFFCCRNCDDILLREQLYELGAFWNFSYEVFVSRADNPSRKYNEVVHAHRLSSRDLEGYVGGKSGQLQALICGSQAFELDVQTQLQRLGVEHLHLF